jgi:transposase
MGRTIKITLDDNQRIALEKGYRSANNHAFRVRCQMVLLKSEGRKSKEIADVLGFCEQAVNSWLWRYKENGIEALKTKAGRGRKSILREATDSALVREAVQKHRQRISLAKSDLERSLGKEFSEKTLIRFLKNLTADTNELENV